MEGRVLIQNNIGEKERWVSDYNDDDANALKIDDEAAALLTACRESPCTANLVNEQRNRPAVVTSTCNGWTLVANAWNTAAGYGYPDALQAAGRFLRSADFEIDFDQVLLFKNNAFETQYIGLVHLIY